MTETVLLGAVVLRPGKKLMWDSQKMRATNAPEADRYIHQTDVSQWLASVEPTPWREKIEARKV